jgi:hypothetical protein
MPKTLSREVIEELQRYKEAPASDAVKLRRPVVQSAPDANSSYSAADISRVVAALILSTQRRLSASGQVRP